MGKASRKKSRTKTATPAPVTALFQAVVALTGKAKAGEPPGVAQVRGLLGCQMDVWRLTPVIVRADSDFITALATTNRDVELPARWTRNVRFPSFAVALDTPVDLFDGTEICRYLGFIATGAKTRPADEFEARIALPVARPELFIDHGVVWTTYHPLDDEDVDGIKYTWLLRHDDGTAGGQTVTVPVDRAAQLGDLMDTASVGLTAGVGLEGREVPTLLTIAVQLTAWLTAERPDLHALPALTSGRSIRGTGPNVEPQLFDAGFRVGAVLRSSGAAPASSGDGTGLTGWRMPPHVREGHWHRVRVATRDERGTIIGDRAGTEGVDWHYRLRWYPPTVVAAGPGRDVPITSRTAEP